jgi:hypothetical protein
LGWEITGIRDGFEGLLNPEHYPDGGLVNLNPQVIENLDPIAGSVLGQSAREDPFNVRTINEYDMVEEVDKSDELLDKLKAENIDAVIAIVGGMGLSISFIAKGLKQFVFRDRWRMIFLLRLYLLVLTAHSLSILKCWTGHVKPPRVPERSL